MRMSRILSREPFIGHRIRDKLLDSFSWQNPPNQDDAQIVPKISLFATDRLGRGGVAGAAESGLANDQALTRGFHYSFGQLS